MHLKLNIKNMKHFILTIILGMFLIGCTSNNYSENVALIEKYIQSVESQDYEVMEAMLDENYLGLGPSYGDSIRKPAALENWKYNIENLYENIKYNRSRSAAIIVSDGEHQGEWVSNWAELTITYKGDMGEVTIWANTVYQIENAKIIKSITFYNEADALYQLGYLIY